MVAADEMKSTDPGFREIIVALQARHGIDASSSAALSARLELALTDLDATGKTNLDARFLDELAQKLRVGETRFYRDGAQLDEGARAWR